MLKVVLRLGGNGKIAQARVKFQDFIRHEIPGQSEQKYIKDFVMYLLENDWFFDIGFKISACRVKPPRHFFQTI